MQLLEIHDSCEVKDSCANKWFHFPSSLGCLILGMSSNSKVVLWGCGTQLGTQSFTSVVTTNPLHLLYFTFLLVGVSFQIATTAKKPRLVSLFGYGLVKHWGQDLSIPTNAKNNQTYQSFWGWFHHSISAYRSLYQSSVPGAFLIWDHWGHPFGFVWK